MNWIWLTLGAGLVGAAVILNSALLLGHGMGVLMQAGFLAVFDLAFLRALRRAVGER